MKEKSHRDLPCFQLEIKSHLIRFCKQQAANVFQPSATKRNSDLSELDSTVNSSLICTWIIMKFRIKIKIVKIAQEIINLSEML